jgi:hypothetical protein
MSINIQIMSGDVYTFSIFDNYRAFNVINDTSRTLNVNKELITLYKEEDGIFNIVHKDDFVDEGDYFYIFIKQEEDRPETLYFTYENDSFILKKKGNIIGCYGWNEIGTNDLEVPDKFNILIQLSIESIDIMRQHIISKVKHDKDTNDTNDTNEDFMNKIYQEKDSDIVWRFYDDFVKLDAIYTYLEFE